MSFCRWSSDNWHSDIYAYADVSGGYTIHVAACRRAGEWADAPWKDFLDGKVTAEAFTEQYNAQMKIVEKAPLKPIGLPYDGETFNEPTAEAFKAKMLELRSVGYNFPDYVLERIDEEIEEEKAQSHG